MKKFISFDFETTGAWIRHAVQGLANFARVDRAGNPMAFDDMVSYGASFGSAGAGLTGYVTPPNVYWTVREKWWKVNGEYNVHPHDTVGAPSVVQFVKEFQNFIKTTGADYLVAHNAPFDAKVLIDSYVSAWDYRGNPSSVTLDGLVGIPVVDSRQVIQSILDQDKNRVVQHYPNCGGRCDGTRLTHLHNELGLGSYKEHSALDDAKALARVWEHFSPQWDGTTGIVSYRFGDEQ